MLIELSVYAARQTTVGGMDGKPGVQTYLRSMWVNLQSVCAVGQMPQDGAAGCVILLICGAELACATPYEQVISVWQTWMRSLAEPVNGEATAGVGAESSQAAPETPGGSLRLLPDEPEPGV